MEIGYIVAIIMGVLLIGMYAYEGYQKYKAKKIAKQRMQENTVVDVKDIIL